MVISHNLTAMNAQRQFNITTNSKAKSSEKLSSGYRINRAADDAAGLAISEKMRRQIRGLNQGALNVQDGISLLQVADGALNEVHDMLQRMNELSVKAANETNTYEDRLAIQEELDQITSETDRIFETAEFNEKKIFVGSDYTIIPAVFQESTIGDLAITGTPSGFSAKTYEIKANKNGINIDGTNISWSSFKGTGSNSLADEAVVADTYATTYKGITISVSAEEDADIEDAIGILNGVKLTIGENYNTEKVEDLFTLTSQYLYNNTFDAKRILSDNAYISYENNRIVIHSGCAYSDYNEILHVSDHDLPDLNTQYRRGDTIELRFTNQNTKSGQATNWARLKINLLKDATLSEIVDGLTKCNVDYKKNLETSNLKMLNVSTTTGNISSSSNGYYQFRDPKQLVDAGYLRNESEIVFTYDGNGWVSDNGNIRFSYTHWYGGDAKELIINNLEEDLPAFDARQINPSIILGFSKLSDMHNPTVGDKIYLKSPTQLGSSYNVGVKNIEPQGEYITSHEEYISDVKKNDYKGREISKEKKIYNTDYSKWWIQASSEINDGLYLTIDTINNNKIGLDDISVLSTPDSLKAIETVKSALSSISRTRSNIGAQQNRLEHTYKNVTNIEEQTQAAESLIRDTDMAKEMVEFSLKNILEQAGVSMMTQANQTNQGVLSLLQ